MSQILLPQTPALPRGGSVAAPFGESSHLIALGGWRQSTLEEKENDAVMGCKESKPNWDCCLFPQKKMMKEWQQDAQIPPISCRRTQPGVKKTRGPGNGPACSHPKAHCQPHSRRAPGCPPAPGSPLPTYPAPTARGSPRSDLRKEKSGYQPAPGVRGNPRSPLGPSPPRPPGAGAGLGPGPGPGGRDEGPAAPSPAPGSR